VDAARASELLPLIEERAILIEDLDAAVAAIGDEDASARIDAMLCGVSNSPGPTALAPRLDERSVLREFHDAVDGRIGDVPSATKISPFGAMATFAGPAEDVGAAAGDAGLAERHQQLPSG
jgi:hypothetical protein